MRRLLELLGNPEEDLKIFHVGGTNGKGSASFYIKAILEAEGYTVGMFTSPHVKKYNERFQYTGEMISDENLEFFAQKVQSFGEQVATEGYGNLSLFETMTAIAYLYFSLKKPDYVIMEVGIGGRIDVTNTIEKPLCSIITQIGFDHIDVLGNTLQEIAMEKAGIIKAGVPIVTQSYEAEVREVIHAVADELDSRVIDINDSEYQITSDAELTPDGTICRFDAEISGKSYKDLEIVMIGEHQVRNALTAANAIASVMELSEEGLRAGLKTAINPGRFEFLHKEKPYFVIDGAHNSNGIKAAIETYKKTLAKIVPENKLLVSFGCLKDKECDIMVMMIADAFCNADFVALEPDSDRAVPAATLREKFEARGCKCRAFEKAESLFEPSNTAEYDAVLCLGSIYLIGEIKSLYDERNQINV